MTTLIDKPGFSNAFREYERAHMSFFTDLPPFVTFVVVACSCLYFESDHSLKIDSA